MTAEPFFHFGNLPQTSKPRRRLSKKRPVNQSSQSVSRILRSQVFLLKKHSSWLALLLLHSLRAGCFLATFKCLQGISWGPTPVVTRRTAIISTAASHGTLMNIAYGAGTQWQKCCLEQELPRVKHPNHKTRGEQLAIVPHCTRLRGTTYTSPKGLLTQGTAGLAGWIPRSSMHHAQESGNLQAKSDNAKQDHSAKSHQSWLNIVPHVLQFQVWNIRYSGTGINYVLWIKTRKTPKLLLVVLNIHSHDFGSYLISYGVDDVHPTIDLLRLKVSPTTSPSCLNDT